MPNIIDRLKTYCAQQEREILDNPELNKLLTMAEISALVRNTILVAVAVSIALYFYVPKRNKTTPPRIDSRGALVDFPHSSRHQNSKLVNNDN